MPPANARAGMGASSARGLGVLAAPDDSSNLPHPPPQGISLSPVRGYLYKQDHDNTTIWRRRFMALYGDTLMYFPSEADWQRAVQEKKTAALVEDNAHDGGVKGVLTVLGSTVYVVTVEPSEATAAIVAADPDAGLAAPVSGSSSRSVANSGRGGGASASRTGTLHGLSFTVARNGRLRSTVLAAASSALRDYWALALARASRHARQVSLAARLLHGLDIPARVLYGDPRLNEALVALASNFQALFLESEHVLLYTYTGRKTGKNPSDRFSRCVLLTSQRILRVHGGSGVLTDIAMSDVARLVYYGPETAEVDLHLSLLVARRPKSAIDASSGVGVLPGGARPSEAMLGHRPKPLAKGKGRVAGGDSDDDDEDIDAYLAPLRETTPPARGGKKSKAGAPRASDKGSEYKLVAELHSGASAELLLTGKPEIDFFYFSVLARAVSFRWWAARDFTTTLQQRRALWHVLADAALRNGVQVTPEEWRGLMVHMGSAQAAMQGLLTVAPNGDIRGRRGGGGTESFCDNVLSQDLATAADTFWNADSFFLTVRGARGGVSVLDSRPLTTVWQAQASAKSFELFLGGFTGRPSQEWVWDDEDRVYPRALAEVLLPRHRAREANLDGGAAAAAAAASAGGIGSEVEEVVWENQRYYPYFRWSSNLLPFDPPAWSDASGARETSLRAVERALPPGWRWTTDAWALQSSRETEHGWWYAAGFGPGLEGWSPVPENVAQVVRKRKWVRKRVCVSITSPIASPLTHDSSSGANANSPMALVTSASNPGAIAHPSTATAAGSVRWEYAYENERWYPGKGWSKALLPTDRPSWSSADGKERVDRAQTRLPSGFVWTDDWAVDEFYGGDDGHWRYALDFPRAWSDENGPLAFVRRRRWRRGRRAQTGGEALGYPAWVLDTPLTLDTDNRIKAHPPTSAGGLGYAQRDSLVLSVTADDPNHPAGEAGVGVAAERLHRQLVRHHAAMKAAKKQQRNAFVTVASKLAALAHFASSPAGGGAPSTLPSNPTAAALADSGMTTLTPAALAALRAAAAAGDGRLSSADASASIAEYLDYVAAPGSGVSLAPAADSAAPLQRWAPKTRADLFLDHDVTPLLAQVELAALEDIKVAASVAAANYLSARCPEVAESRERLFALQAKIAAGNRRAPRATATKHAGSATFAHGSSSASASVPAPASAAAPGAVMAAPSSGPFGGDIVSPLGTAGASAALAAADLVRSANAGPIILTSPTPPGRKAAREAAAAAAAEAAKAQAGSKRVRFFPDPAASSTTSTSPAVAAAAAAASAAAAAAEGSAPVVRFATQTSPGRYYGAASPAPDSYYAAAAASGATAAGSSAGAYVGPKMAHVGAALTAASPTIPGSGFPQGPSVLNRVSESSGSSGSSGGEVLVSPQAQRALPSAAFEAAIVPADPAGGRQGELLQRVPLFFTSAGDPSAGEAAGVLRSPLDRPPIEPDTSAFRAARGRGVDVRRLPLRFVPPALTPWVRVWSTGEVAAGPAFSVWRAAATPGFAMLGDILSPSSKAVDPSVPALVEDRPDLLPPLSFSPRLVVSGEPGTEPLIVCEMRPPVGYVALGLAAGRGRLPDPAVYRCVPAYLCVEFESDIEGGAPVGGKGGEIKRKNKLGSAAAAAAAATGKPKKSLKATLDELEDISDLSSDEDDADDDEEEEENAAPKGVLQGKTGFASKTAAPSKGGAVELAPLRSRPTPIITSSPPAGDSPEAAGAAIAAAVAGAGESAGRVAVAEKAAELESVAAKLEARARAMAVEEDAAATAAGSTETKDDEEDDEEDEKDTTAPTPLARSATTHAAAYPRPASSGSSVTPPEPRRDAAGRPLPSYDVALKAYGLRLLAAGLRARAGPEASATVGRATEGSSGKAKEEKKAAPSKKARDTIADDEDDEGEDTFDTNAANLSLPEVTGAFSRTAPLSTTSGISLTSPPAPSTILIAPSEHGLPPAALPLPAERVPTAAAAHLDELERLRLARLAEEVGDGDDGPAGALGAPNSSLLSQASISASAEARSSVVIRGLDTPPSANAAATGEGAGDADDMRSGVAIENDRISHEAAALKRPQLAWFQCKSDFSPASRLAAAGLLTSGAAAAGAAGGAGAAATAATLASSASGGMALPAQSALTLLGSGPTGAGAPPSLAAAALSGTDFRLFASPSMGLAEGGWKPSVVLGAPPAAIPGSGSRGTRGQAMVRGAGGGNTPAGPSDLCPSVAAVPAVASLWVLPVGGLMSLGLGGFAGREKYAPPQRYSRLPYRYSITPDILAIRLGSRANVLLRVALSVLHSNADERRRALQVSGVPSTPAAAAAAAVGDADSRSRGKSIPGAGTATPRAGAAVSASARRAVSKQLVLLDPAQARNVAKQMLAELDDDFGDVETEADERLSEISDYSDDDDDDDESTDQSRVRSRNAAGGRPRRRSRTSFGDSDDEDDEDEDEDSDDSLPAPDIPIGTSASKSASQPKGKAKPVRGRDFVVDSDESDNDSFVSASAGSSLKRARGRDDLASDSDDAGGGAATMGGFGKSPSAAPKTKTKARSQGKSRDVIAMTDSEDGDDSAASLTPAAAKTKPMPTPTPAPVAASKARLGTPGQKEPKVRKSGKKKSVKAKDGKLSSSLSLTAPAPAPLLMPPAGPTRSAGPVPGRPVPRSPASALAPPAFPGAARPAPAPLDAVGLAEVLSPAVRLIRHLLAHIEDWGAVVEARIALRVEMKQREADLVAAEAAAAAASAADEEAEAQRKEAEAQRKEAAAAKAVPVMATKASAAAAANGFGKKDAPAVAEKEVEEEDISLVSSEDSDDDSADKKNTFAKGPDGKAVKPGTHDDSTSNDDDDEDDDDSLSGAGRGLTQGGSVHGGDDESIGGDTDEDSGLESPDLAPSGPSRLTVVASIQPSGAAPVQRDLNAAASAAAAAAAASPTPGTSAGPTPRALVLSSSAPSAGPGRVASGVVAGRSAVGLVGGTLTDFLTRPLTSSLLDSHELVALSAARTELEKLQTQLESAFTSTKLSLLAELVHVLFARKPVWGSVRLLVRRLVQWADLLPLLPPLSLSEIHECNRVLADYGRPQLPTARSVTRQPFAAILHDQIGSFVELRFATVVEPAIAKLPRRLARRYLSPDDAAAAPVPAPATAVVPKNGAAVLAGKSAQQQAEEEFAASLGFTLAESTNTAPVAEAPQPRAEPEDTALTALLERMSLVAQDLLFVHGSSHTVPELAKLFAFTYQFHFSRVLTGPLLHTQLSPAQCAQVAAWLGFYGSVLAQVAPGHVGVGIRSQAHELYLAYRDTYLASVRTRLNYSTQAILDAGQRAEGLQWEGRLGGWHSSAGVDLFSLLHQSFDVVYAQQQLGGRVLGCAFELISSVQAYYTASLVRRIRVGMSMPPPPAPGSVPADGKKPKKGAPVPAPEPPKPYNDEDGSGGEDLWVRLGSAVVPYSALCAIANDEPTYSDNRQALLARFEAAIGSWEAQSAPETAAAAAAAAATASGSSLAESSDILMGDDNSDSIPATKAKIAALTQQTDSAFTDCALAAVDALAAAAAARGRAASAVLFTSAWSADPQSCIKEWLAPIDSAAATVLRGLDKRTPWPGLFVGRLVRSIVREYTARFCDAVTKDKSKHVIAPPAPIASPDGPGSPGSKSSRSSTASAPAVAAPGAVPSAEALWGALQDDRRSIYTHVRKVYIASDAGKRYLSAAAASGGLSGSVAGGAAGGLSKDSVKEDMGLMSHLIAAGKVGPAAASATVPALAKVLGDHKVPDASPSLTLQAILFAVFTAGGYQKGAAEDAIAAGTAAIRAAAAADAAAAANDSGTFVGGLLTAAMGGAGAKSPPSMSFSVNPGDPGISRSASATAAAAAAAAAGVVTSFELMVVAESGRDLPARNTDGVTSDPYVIVRLMGLDSNGLPRRSIGKARTARVDRCLSPEWWELMRFDGARTMGTHTVDLSVFDWNFLAGDASMGSASVTMQALIERCLQHRASAGTSTAGLTRAELRRAALARALSGPQGGVLRAALAGDGSDAGLAGAGGAALLGKLRQRDAVLKKVVALCASRGEWVWGLCCERIKLLTSAGDVMTNTAGDESSVSVMFILISKE